MCTSHNLGPRVRQHHVRVGVVWLGLTLVLGFGLVEWGLASSLGILLIAPLTIGTYCLLAGTFGVCLYTGMAGRRVADHGSEGVPDAELRQSLVRRGVGFAALSGTIAVLATALFMASS